MGIEKDQSSNKSINMDQDDLELLTDVINLPNSINQMIQQEQYALATK